VSGDVLTPDVGPQDHVAGPANARVTLVEYGDYECPRCFRARQVLDVVLEELGDGVRFVFRNFPVTDSHPHAEMAAEAAESVAAHAGVEAFWTMHAILYENQDALEEDDLLGYAQAAGADLALVGDDLARGRLHDRVRGDFRSGLRSGVTGTPTFFLNGRRFDGDWAAPEAFIAAIEDAARSILH
jgi:protein-disulfide isomerase